MILGVILGLPSCVDKPRISVNDFVTKIGISFSSDSIRFDTIPSLYLTPMREAKLYNLTEKKPLKIKHIRLKNASSSVFRLNINGMSATSVDNIDIEYGDSISIFINVFVKNNPKEQTEQLADSIIITKEDNTSTSIYIDVFCQKTQHINDIKYNTNSQIAENTTILLHDSIIVEENATLEISKGCKIWMDKNAYIRVKGSLHIRGEKGSVVRITSIRKDDLIPKISYSLVPGQFRGIIFSPSSVNNKINFLRMNNGQFGLYFDDKTSINNSTEVLSMRNSRITNMSGEGVRLSRGVYNISDSEISNSLGPCFYGNSGVYNIERSDIVNFYSWKGIRVSKALVYEFRDIENKDIESILKIKHCVIAGAFPLRKDTGGNYTGGEVALNIKDTDRAKVNISDSFASMSVYNQQNITEENIIRPEDTKDFYKNVFFSLGFDKDGKLNYVYDFTPLESAPFYNKGVGKTDVDINGYERGSLWPYGAYTEKKEDKKK